MKRIHLITTAAVALLGATGFILTPSGKHVSLVAARAEAAPAPEVKVNPLKDAYYGDLHLHTTYSFDAYVLMGTKVDPDAAYRFARGEAVDFLGSKVKRREPLDFLAVTDHSENIGVFNQLEDPNSALSKSEVGQAAKKGGIDVFKNVILKYVTQPIPGVDTKPISASAWQREIDAANRNYQPGRFTTFIAYEWSSMPDGQNLHRNVIFKGDKAPIPFSSADSRDPRDLWNYLEKSRKNGYEALAIPHNANASNGLMYDWTSLDGKPIDKAYAKLRAANEPLSEISQNKGSSETHPLLSPNDEFANFEIFDQLLISATKSKPQGSYVRDALGRGLILEQKIGANPYKDGIVGATDYHSGLSTSAEGDYAGNIGRSNLGPGKPTKEEASQILGLTPREGDWKGFNVLITGSGNITGAWAESNTRDSIYSAFRRKGDLRDLRHAAEIPLLRRLEFRSCAGEVGGLGRAGLRQRRSHGRRSAVETDLGERAAFHRLGHEGSQQRQSRSRAGREGLGRERPAERKSLRRRVVR